MTCAAIFSNMAHGSWSLVCCKVLGNCLSMSQLAKLKSSTPHQVSFWTWVFLKQLSKYPKKNRCSMMICPDNHHWNALKSDIFSTHSAEAWPHRCLAETAGCLWGAASQTGANSAATALNHWKIPMHLSKNGFEALIWSLNDGWNLKLTWLGWGSRWANLSLK